MTVDQTAVRQTVAAQAITLAATLVDAFYALRQLRDQRSFAGWQWVDEDFATEGLRHLDAQTMQALFEGVLPAFEAAFTDAEHAGLATQILARVRPGGRAALPRP